MLDNYFMFIRSLSPWVQRLYPRALLMWLYQTEAQETTTLEWGKAGKSRRDEIVKGLNAKSLDLRQEPGTWDTC